MKKIMKTDYLLGVWMALAMIIEVAYSVETNPTNKDHPIYKYGYVVSHKEGGSQAHVETRNGNMTLGRYYVNFPNGSGQKVTYLADDVGFHTGVVYSSQTKKGSSKTRIAMGHKALATLENLERTESTTPKTISPTPHKGIKATIKVPVSTTTIKPEENHSNASYTFTRGFYLLRQPVESVTSNHIELSSPSPTPDSDVQQSFAVPQKTSFSTSEVVPVQTNSAQKPQQQQQQLESTLWKLNGYLPTLQQQRGNHPGVVRQQTKDPVPMYTSDKSIEKTVLTDLDAQLISKIQKHADGIIMNDLKKKPATRIQTQRLVYTVKPETKSVTMQPIVVTAANDVRKINNFDNKANKNVQSGTINSLRTAEKEKTSSDDQISKTSEVALNITQSANEFSDLKAMNRNSDSANFTLCESNLCVQDNNRAFSDSLVSIKPRPEIALGADIRNGRKLPPNFYPKNQLKHEMHYVTTIDVQKGISLEVQQNEDGSIRLANNFPFNKLPNYQRPFNPSTSSPILSNSITPTHFSTTQNVHLTPDKPYLTSSVTPAPEFYDVTPNKPLLQAGQNVQVQDHHPKKVAVVYQFPQPVSSGITHITTDQMENLLKPTDNHNLPQIPPPQTGIVFINHQPPTQEEEQRKQNFVEEERKEYFENLKKVEQITQQNSASPQPEVAIHPNGLTEDVTPAPILSIESNSVKPTEVESEQQVHYVPEVQTASFQNDVGNYAQEVPVTYPTVQDVQTPVVLQKPVFAYAPQYISSETEAPNGYYDPQNVQNVFIDNSLQQQTLQSPEKDELPSYAFSQQAQAEERVEPVQHLALPQERINPIQVPVEPRFLRQQKGLHLDKTILINPLMTVNYGRAFKVEQPVSLLSAYPMQLQSGSELSSIYQLPQQYQLSVPIQQIQQLPQAQNMPPPFPPPSFNTPVSPGQYHVTMSYKPTPNKLRIQPLKPSPPAEEETRMESIRNLLSQPQFNPTYYYAGFPAINRLQLRHVGRKKQPNFDQVAAQSLTRRDKSLKNLKIEYGFKPPLRPSVEFSEEVKPSIYGPSVPLR